MPGSGFEMQCSRCSPVHRVMTGGDGLLTENAWSYRQFVCSNCETLASGGVPVSSDEVELTCETCQAPLVSWTGRVWLDRSPDGGISPEPIVGPCPRCGQTITEHDSEVLISWD
jgi:hypothetical protein